MTKWIIVLITAILVGATASYLEAQSGPYSAQIQRALISLKASGNTWAGSQNFTGGTAANGVAGATHAACSTSVTAITVTSGIITAITCT